ncbi:hypothetical protein EB232_35310 (plasmid) [Mesorhizobium sp. NZP2077]|nr:hypothetical protein EB232_35310 [Mesorhizobium sp. NZP2077]
MNWLGDAAQYMAGSMRHLFRRPYRAIVREGSLPKLIAPRTLYILNEDGEAWQAVVLQLNVRLRQLLQKIALNDENRCA